MTSLSNENRAARRGLITASAIGDIIAGGAARAAVIKRLRLERGGGDAADFDTPAMAAGRRDEAAILESFGDRYNSDMASHGLLCSLTANADFIKGNLSDGDRAVWFGATPDGILTGENYKAPVEVKRPLDKNFISQSESPPEKYIWQVRFQCLVMGVSHGFLVFGSPDFDGGFATKSHRVECAASHCDFMREVILRAEREVLGVKEDYDLARKIGECAELRGRLNEIDRLEKAAIARIKEICDDLRGDDAAAADKISAVVLEKLRGVSSDQIPPGLRRAMTKRVVVSDVSLLPDKYVSRTPKKREIGAAIAAGENVAGAAVEEVASLSIPARKPAGFVVEVLRGKITGAGLLQHQGDQQ